MLTRSRCYVLAGADVVVKTNLKLPIAIPAMTALPSCLYFTFLFFLQVVLPTFILEPRSLLEMFADFFAHPDLFVK